MQNTSWIDLHQDYRKSLYSIKNYKEKKKVVTIADQVDKSIASEIVSSLSETTKEIKKKIYHEYNAISVDDIQNPVYGLSTKQKEMLLLRQKRMTNKEIAENLQMDVRNVLGCYKKAANRIIKIKHDKLAILTKKQREIYDMRQRAMKYQQIAEKLNISVNSVKSHIKEINKKLKRVRKLHDLS
ncbi:hypothetical protein JYT99_00675 [bacterium AH-315-E09]|nr:hypothetical protein [bacterium AH-315-E09]